LTADCDATFLAGGRECEDQTLDRGTLIRNWVTHDTTDTGGGIVHTFAASSDDGRLWYRYQSRDALTAEHLRPHRYAETVDETGASQEVVRSATIRQWIKAGRPVGA